MEGSEGVRLVELGEGEMEGVVDACERVFRVGESVEFWGGPAVGVIHEKKNFFGNNFDWLNFSKYTR